MQILNITSAQEVISYLTGIISNNIVGILLVLGTIVGVSIVSAMLDSSLNPTYWRSGYTGKRYKL